MKCEVFKNELELIKNDNIKSSAKIILNSLPDYFYKIPAASTGKYHPFYAQGEGGLIRHTKAAVMFANDLFEIYKFDDNTKDLIILSLLIHDGLKKGIVEEKYTRFDHPIIIGNFVESIKDKLDLTNEELNSIKSMTSSHMGKWNTNEPYSSVVLPLPKTVNQKFVHMCDFLSSRKEIEIKFKENEIVH